ncbi:MAG: DUF4192 family protein [Planctomycetales bacterium]
MWTLIWVAVSFCLLVYSATLLIRDSRSPLGVATLAAALIAPALVLACLIHELGHAVLGRLAGLSIYRIALAAGGSVLFRRRFRDCEFVLNSVPFGGHTLAAPKPGEWLRLRVCVFLLGGCLANILAISAAVAGWILTRSLVVHAFLAPQIFMNLLLLVNLFPFRLRRAELGKLESDGLGLLAWPFRNGDRLQQLRLSHFWLAGAAAADRNELPLAESHYQSGLHESPGHAVGLAGLAHVEFLRGKLNHARDLLIQVGVRSLIETGRTDGEYWRLALIDVLLFRRELLWEADHLSGQAFRRAPWTPGIRAVRGAVLAMTGDVHEGLTLIDQSIKSFRGRDRALPLSLLAVARWRAGDHVGAAAALNLARQADPDCALLPRIGYQLGEPVPDG